VERLRAAVSALQDELAQARSDAEQARVRAAEAETARDEAEATEPGRAGGSGTGPAAQPPARRKLGWRGPVSVLLIVLGCVLAPISVLGVWTAGQVSNTDRYVANVAPLIRAPAVQGALTDKISAAVTREIDVQAITKQAARQLSARGLNRLGALISNFSSSIASGVDGLIHTVVSKIVTHPFVARIWVQANRIAHTQLVKALSAKSSSLSISNGKVVIGLGPFIDQVKHRLAARGLTIVNSLPPINPTFPLFSAKYLVQARSVYTLLTTLRWVLPILTLALLGLGIYVARRHRRALVGAGLGVALSMLVLGAVLAIARAIYLHKVPSSVLPADAAAVVFDTIVRFIRQALQAVLVLGLVVAIAGFCTGPSSTAVRLRDSFKNVFGYARGSGEKAGVSTGQAGEWMYRYRQPLRIAAVAGAVLILVLWTYPTGLVVALIAIFLLIVLSTIELLARPPAGVADAGTVADSGTVADGGVAVATAGAGRAGGPGRRSARTSAAAGTGVAASASPAGTDARRDVPPQAPSAGAEGKWTRTPASAGKSHSTGPPSGSQPSPDSKST